MKLKVIPSIIVLFISTLISYGFYSILNLKTHYLFVHSIVTFVFSFTTLTVSFGCQYEYPRTGVLLKTIGVVFFLVSFLLLSLLSVFTSNISTLITLSGIVYMVFCLITYSIYNSKQ